MAKVPIALRLQPEDVTRVDAYAKARGASRQVVLETFVLGGLEDVLGGVPDLVAPEPPASKPTAKSRPSVFADAGGSRQQRLNAAMLRTRGQRGDS